VSKFLKPRAVKTPPSGIPSIIDRCLQAIVKYTLEQKHRTLKGQATAEPGKKPHDIEIYGICRLIKRKKWVVDADIQRCFDNLDHEYLMKRIGNFPAGS